MERAVLSRQQALFGAPLGGLCSLSICRVRKGGQCSGFRPSGVLPQQQGQLAAGRGDRRALRQQVFQDGAGGQFVDAEACSTHHSNAACHGQHCAEPGAVSAVDHRFVRDRVRLRTLAVPLPVGIEGDILGDQLQTLILIVIGLILHRLTAVACSVPANELIAFPLRAHAGSYIDRQTFADASSLCGKAICGKAHLIVAVIPLAAALTDPAVIRAPGSAAIEVEGNGVVRGGGGVGGDLEISRIGRPCPAAARHLRPCAAFRRAVPEVGRVHSQVTFAQLDEIAVGGIQLQGSAGEGHGTVVDAGLGTHREAAAVYGRPAVQAAFCPGDGHHAAALDRDTAIVDGCGCAVDLQRAAAFDRGTLSADAIVHITNGQDARNIHAVGVCSVIEFFQCDIRPGGDLCLVRLRENTIPGLFCAGQSSRSVNCD